MPDDFHRRVVSAARRRSGQRFGSAWRRRLMLAYWLTAAAASYLLLTLSWPARLDALAAVAALDAMDWIVVGGSALALAVPTLILRSILRVDLVEVWFRTIE